ncbi:hypothetical protein ACS6BV_004695 [Vibrio alginolyticus]|uniref:hypothetical protein n=1 Tax=Vibrio TaxID=662 RepID=UPI0006A791BC
METKHIKTGLIDIDSVQNNVVRQSEFLNSVLGILAFTLGLSCLSFQDPQSAAFTCLGILIPIYIKAINMTHPDILALRKLVKETQDAHAKAVLAHLEDNFIGFRVFLTRNVVFWYGVGFFLVVLHNPDWLFHYALNLVIKVVCGGIGIALLTP